MNTHEHGPSPLCERVGRLLPLLDDAELGPSQTAEAHDHLRTCVFCQARRAEYRSLDSALRQRFGLASVPYRSTEEIMRHIPNDTSEHMSTRGAAVTPNARRTQRRTQRWTRKPFLGGLGAVVACVALIALTFALYGGRLGVGLGSTHFSGPPRYSFAGTTGSFASISMISPHDGWALAQVLKTPQGRQSLHDVALYHYAGGKWSPTYVTTSQDFSTGGISGFNGSISMDSATDGWADAHNFNRVSVLLHYSHGMWSEVSGPEIYGIQAISPTSVWGIAVGDPGSVPGITGGDYGAGAGIAHYDGATWSNVSLPGFSNGNGAHVASFSMLPDGTGWALATTSATTYEMLRYSGGAWTVHSTLTTSETSDYSTFAMLSPSEGWLLGQNTVTGPDGTTAHVPLQQVLYHYTNGHWSQASL
ncbi:MAG: anti-sigma factor family protein, partial [Ktedonobacterales bacterium]